MKRILSTSFLLTVFLVSPRLFASTSVGASLSTDTQWDQSGNPYIIQSRVLVPPGVTLKIGSGVQIVFQGPATLRVSGELKVEGSAAAPAVFNMTNGGLQNALVIDGGEARLNNMKVLGGVFLAEDATIRMNGSEVTKGSGLYLKGNTTAYLRNNQFYGNATGVVLDGPIDADVEFNTLVQNTYGLYLKDFSKIVFVNNSVHDNDSEVVDNAYRVKLGGNYWGTMRFQTVIGKIKGAVSISPMKDLKDILRAYLRSELPVITKGMSKQAEAEDKRADKAAGQALKEFRQKQAFEAIHRPMPPVPASTPTITVSSPAPAMESMLNLPIPGVVPVPTVESMPLMPPPAITGVSPSSNPSLPAPPEMTGGAAMPGSSLSPPPAISSVSPSSNPSLPPPEMTGGVAMPGSSLSPPPAISGVSSSSNPSLPAPPEMTGGAAMPGSSLSPPPAITGVSPSSNTALPAAPEMTGGTATPGSSVPPPPDLLTGMPMPPSLPPGASEPPALGNLAASAAAASPSTSPSGLGVSPVSSGEMAPTMTGAAETPSQAIPAPPDLSANLPAPASNNSAVGATAAPVENFSPMIIPTPALPDSSSIPGSTASQASILPVITNTAASTASFTSTPTFTSTPVVSTSTPTPVVSNAAAVSSTPSLKPITPKDLVPPPPDFSDASNATGLQPPIVTVPNTNAATPAAPAPSGVQSPKTDAPATNVDGMQAPPMDSGLDFSLPKK